MNVLNAYIITIMLCVHLNPLQDDTTGNGAPEEGRDGLKVDEPSEFSEGC
jgi:hypothetical protein